MSASALSVWRGSGQCCRQRLAPRISSCCLSTLPRSTSCASRLMVGTCRRQAHRARSSRSSWRLGGGRRSRCVVRSSDEELPHDRDKGHRALRSESDAGIAQKIASLLNAQERRLVLHFDLNKTLIMIDPAGGKTQSQVLNGILSEICWGFVSAETSGQDDAEPVWRWNRRPPSTEQPGAELVTYSDFLQDRFGDGEGLDNDHMKAVRDERKGSFTDMGHPGAGLREDFVALEEALCLPLSATRSSLRDGAGLAGRSSYYVIPSFFECLKALQDARAPFSLVFRTFGSDLDGVARELNAFCEGRHPCFPGIKMDGSNGLPDYRIHLSDDDGDGDKGRTSNVGAFYRDSDGIALALGTLDNPHSRQQLRDLEEKGHRVYRSILDIHDYICSARLCPSIPASTSESCQPLSDDNPSGSITDSGLGKVRDDSANSASLALRDYYPYWRQRLEAADAGKLLPVDLKDDAKASHVMFDDNIGRLGSKMGAHIVDVRDIDSGQSVPLEEALQRHLVRAEPYLAVLQGNVRGTAHAKHGQATRGQVYKAGNYFLSEILTALSRTQSLTLSSLRQP